MSDNQLSGFNKPIGILPLPNVVLFPGARLPLHIFEPRYRMMVQDALEGEAMIGMALLRLGYEALYYTNYAKIHPVVGVGQIQEHIQVADGRYFVKLQGICRARVLQEYYDGEYRMALLEPIPQVVSGIDTDGEFAARQSFSQVLNTSVFDDIEKIDLFRNLIDKGASLSEIVDKIAYTLLPADSIETQQCILEELNVLERASLLLKELRAIQQTLNLTKRTRENWPHTGSNN